QGLQRALDTAPIRWMRGDSDMITRHSICRWTVAALMLAGITHAGAEAQATKDADLGRAGLAWENAIVLLDGVLGAKQRAGLNILAYHAAVAAICDGFKLDQTKFSGAFSKLEHAEDAKMSEAEKRYFERHLLVNYGMMVGTFIAEAGASTETFCAHAAEEKAEKDAVHYWE
ncbi:MAG: hypothetical protein ACR2PO_03435, partial [Methyloligellaceae bacterium]